MEKIREDPVLVGYLLDSWGYDGTVRIRKMPRITGEEGRAGTAQGTCSQLIFGRKPHTTERETDARPSLSFVFYRFPHAAVRLHFRFPAQRKRAGSLPPCMAVSAGYLSVPERRFLLTSVRPAAAVAERTIMPSQRPMRLLSPVGGTGGFGSSGFSGSHCATKV